MKHLSVAACLLVAVVLASCATKGPTLGKDFDVTRLSDQELVQLARQETNRTRWANAMVYYAELRERDVEAKYIAEAGYKIAFLTYKRKDYEGAVKLFRTFLDESESHPEYPHWTKVLSEKVLETIEEDLAKKKKKPASQQ